MGLLLLVYGSFLVIAVGSKTVVQSSEYTPAATSALSYFMSKLYEKNNDSPEDLNYQAPLTSKADLIKNAVPSVDIQKPGSSYFIKGRNPGTVTDKETEDPTPCTRDQDRTNPLVLDNPSHDTVINIIIDRHPCNENSINSQRDCNNPFHGNKISIEIPDEHKHLEGDCHPDPKTSHKPASVEEPKGASNGEDGLTIYPEKPLPHDPLNYGEIGELILDLLNFLRNPKPEKSLEETDDKNSVNADGGKLYPHPKGSDEDEAISTLKPVNIIETIIDSITGSPSQPAEPINPSPELDIIKTIIDSINDNPSEPAEPINPSPELNIIETIIDSITGNPSQPAEPINPSPELDIIKTIIDSINDNPSEPAEPANSTPELNIIKTIIDSITGNPSEPAEPINPSPEPDIIETIIDSITSNPSGPAEPINPSPELNIIETIIDSITGNPSQPTEPINPSPELDIIKTIIDSIISNPSEPDPSNPETEKERPYPGTSEPTEQPIIGTAPNIKSCENDDIHDVSNSEECSLTDILEEREHTKNGKKPKEDLIIPPLNPSNQLIQPEVDNHPPPVLIFPNKNDATTIELINQIQGPKIVIHQENDKSLCQNIKSQLGKQKAIDDPPQVPHHGKTTTAPITLQAIINTIPDILFSKGDQNHYSKPSVSKQHNKGVYLIQKKIVRTVENEEAPEETDWFDDDYVSRK